MKLGKSKKVHALLRDYYNLTNDEQVEFLRELGIWGKETPKPKKVKA